MTVSREFYDAVRPRFSGRYLLVPYVPEGYAAIVTARIDTATAECSLTCTVTWPDEVLLSDYFGSEWLRWDA